MSDETTDVTVFRDATQVAGTGELMVDLQGGVKRFGCGDAANFNVGH